MLPLVGYFKGLFTNIRPPQDRLDLAQDLPNQVRDHLVASEKLRTVEDDPKTHLAGSYARFTAIGNLKDVDTLVFVDPTYETDEPDAEAVLDDLAAALKDLEVDGYGKGEVKVSRLQRRSHHVEFKRDGEEAFHIDVVPVIRRGDKADRLRIPDRDWNAWDDTQPIGYADRLTSLNEANDKKVRKSIRMLKQVKAYHMPRARRPKSYWLETWVYSLWCDGRMDSTWGYADLAYEMLEKIRADCGATPRQILDPCLFRNLTETWEQAEYDDFVALLDRLLPDLRAIKDDDDADASIAAWRKTFGPAFDLTDEDKKAEADARALTGASKVTGAGLLVPLAAPVKGVPVAPHRFYGDR